MLYFGLAFPLFFRLVVFCAYVAAYNSCGYIEQDSLVLSRLPYEFIFTHSASFIPKTYYINESLITPGALLFATQDSQGIRFAATRQLDDSTPNSYCVGIGVVGQEMHCLSGTYNTQPAILAASGDSALTGVTDGETIALTVDSPSGIIHLLDMDQPSADQYLSSSVWLPTYKLFCWPHGTTTFTCMDYEKKTEVEVECIYFLGTSMICNGTVTYELDYSSPALHGGLGGGKLEDFGVPTQYDSFYLRKGPSLQRLIRIYQDFHFTTPHRAAPAPVAITDDFNLTHSRDLVRFYQTKPGRRVIADVISAAGFGTAEVDFSGLGLDSDAVFVNFNGIYRIVRVPSDEQLLAIYGEPHEEITRVLLGTLSITQLPPASNPIHGSLQYVAKGAPFTLPEGHQTYFYRNQLLRWSAMETETRGCPLTRQHSYSVTVDRPETGAQHTFTFCADYPVTVFAVSPFTVFVLLDRGNHEVSFGKVTSDGTLTVTANLSTIGNVHVYCSDIDTGVAVLRDRAAPFRSFFLNVHKGLIKQFFINFLGPPVMRGDMIHFLVSVEQDSHVESWAIPLSSRFLNDPKALPDDLRPVILGHIPRRIHDIMIYLPQIFSIRSFPRSDFQSDGSSVRFNLITTDKLARGTMLSLQAAGTAQSPYHYASAHLTCTGDIEFIEVDVSDATRALPSDASNVIMTTYVPPNPSKTLGLLTYTTGNTTVVQGLLLKRQPTVSGSVNVVISLIIIALIGAASIPLLCCKRMTLYDL